MYPNVGIGPGVSGAIAKSSKMLPDVTVHGVWVTSVNHKGSYGRIAIEDDLGLWINWEKIGKSTHAASVMPMEMLKILPVQPEPWFARCTYCGEYGLPIQYKPKEKP